MSQKRFLRLDTAPASYVSLSLSFPLCVSLCLTLSLSVCVGNLCAWSQEFKQLKLHITKWAAVLEIQLFCLCIFQFGVLWMPRYFFNLNALHIWIEAAPATTNPLKDRVICWWNARNEWNANADVRNSLVQRNWKITNIICLSTTFIIQNLWLFKHLMIFSSAIHRWLYAWIAQGRNNWMCMIYLFPFVRSWNWTANRHNNQSKAFHAFHDAQWLFEPISLMRFAMGYPTQSWANLIIEFMHQFILRLLK